MSNLNKDISVGVMFITGIFGFLNGSFIISTLIFATAAVFSNLHFGTEMQEEIHHSSAENYGNGATAKR